ncbi:MAG: hypothetical protein KGL68_13250 [Burkholderiales bacterium]|nr:hypothetical protein [Burkholderiales bacterium]
MKLQSLFAVIALAAAGTAFASPAADTKAAPVKPVVQAAKGAETRTMAKDDKALRHERWVAAQDSFPNPQVSLNSPARQQRMDQAYAAWRSEQG